MHNNPNIIMITVDQLAAAALKSYGGNIDSTPTIDALSRNGMRFERYYAHSPLCAPNRASMLTGRSLAYHGITQNNLVLSPDHPTYAKVLKKSGYHTGAFGKFHQTPMQLPLPHDFSMLGFDESIATEDTKLGPWLDWIKDQHPQQYETALSLCWPVSYISSYGEQKIDLKEEWHKAYTKSLEPLIRSSTWGLMYSSPLPKELHQTTYITDLALDFLDRHNENKDNTPFFCHVSYVDPHDPYDPPVPYDTLFSSEDMDLPIPYQHADHDNETLKLAREFHGFDRVSKEPGNLKKLHALYHGSLRFIDDQIGRIMDKLDQNGDSDQTIIIFTSDHGDMLGDHGFITKGVMHYDKSIRCPLIISGCGIDIGVSDRLTTSLDLFPTFCGWAGVETLPPLEGKSFDKDIYGDKEAWQEITVQVEKVRSIITDDGWRLTIYDHGLKGEMFNLRADPLEQHNLYADPAWVDKKISLLERHVLAYMHPMSVQGYRDLPIVDGQRYLVDGFDLRPTF